MSSKTSDTSEASNQQAQVIMAYLLDNVAKFSDKIVTNEVLIQQKNEALEQLLLEAYHEGQIKLLVLMLFSIIWWKTKCEEDLKEVPLAVARDFLKAEHDAYVMEELADADQQVYFNREMMADELKEVKAERKMLADGKKRLRADRVHFMVEKKTVRAREYMQAFVQQDSVPVLEQQEQSTFARRQEGSFGEPHTQKGNIENASTSTSTSTAISGEQTISGAKLNDPITQQLEAMSLSDHEQNASASTFATSGKETPSDTNLDKTFTAATEASSALAVPRPATANISSLEAMIREALRLVRAPMPPQGTTGTHR
ncbi:hypothetical protein SMACR_09669 [Sordaria macrospora]|uniref:WGS project CABT00000000 data, contig 2.144 n=2 Tax=Sordaria macrospora TaxID=5147 RepID=F7WCJ3_SORMK|nr:uncharacterized protein SMAC_09669 [Sordaria macrospora k-hell]KAA8630339.1 hypothetical protein SMACR_09669 [Sordaria macrospora]KAH7625351.1 hypothetical protein B0T09DRAFT_274057 [Sordaria sp. MPI-SDFR-AT-0083]WPJ62662.1 hypothetical protein SMAC4_09669 [Sordaria macrospora]CCC05635.1 unnamed protein product [Sordaria macrospora k-hell]